MSCCIKVQGWIQGKEKGGRGQIRDWGQIHSNLEDAEGESPHMREGGRNGRRKRGGGGRGEGGPEERREVGRERGREGG